MARGLSITIAVLATLVAAVWLSGRSLHPVSDAVAPAHSGPAAEVDARDSQEAPRRTIELPVAETTPTVAEVEGPPAAHTATRDVGPVEPVDLDTLSLNALIALERELTQEISVSTVDELRWRFEHGLGELAGTGDDFDIGKAWQHDRIMNTVSPGDGTHWRVALPREEFPEAYALWDRRDAVRSQIEIRRRRGERWVPFGG